MIISRLRIWNTFSLGICLVLVALTLTPASGASQETPLDIDPDQLRQMILSARPERPKTGRNIVQALQAEKKYATFLAIVDRAGMTSLLQGATKDTTTPKIVVVEDSLQVSVSLDESNLPADADIALFKSQVADQMRAAAGGAMMALLAEEGRITVFAPTDEAFDKLPKARRDSLRTNPTVAAEFIRGYIVNRGIYRDAFGKLRSMTPLAGPGLQVGMKPAGIATVNGSAMVKADIAADNGVAHGIDTVLDPHAPASGGSVVPKKA